LKSVSTHAVVIEKLRSSSKDLTPGKDAATMLRTLQSRVSGCLSAQVSRMVSNTASTTPAALEDDAEPDTRIRSERCLNRVTLIGRVGRTPEQRGNAENPCLIFPLATNLVYRKADGERMVKTDWHRVAVFSPGLRDHVASRIEKGDRLLVEGSISYMRYINNENKPVNSVSIKAEEIMFLGRRRGTNREEEEEEEEEEEGKKS
jgi:single-strand DNA-binding protein